MRHEVRSLIVPATGQNGTPRSIDDLDRAHVRIDGTGAGAFSCSVQGKISGAGDTASDVWFNIDAGPITASKVVDVSAAPWTHVRIVSTTTGSPAFTAAVAGFNMRSDLS